MRAGSCGAAGAGSPQCMARAGLALALVTTVHAQQERLCKAAVERRQEAVATVTEVTLWVTAEAVVDMLTIQTQAEVRSRFRKCS